MKLIFFKFILLYNVEKNEKNNNNRLSQWFLPGVEGIRYYNGGIVIIDDA